MLNERDERLDARLLAIELFLVQLIAAPYIARPGSARDAHTALQVRAKTWQLQVRAAVLPVPEGTDPAVRDLRAQLLDEAMGTILARLQEYVREHRPLP